MKSMRHWMLAAILIICGTMKICAQTNLIGRSYQNENIMQAEMDKLMNEVDKKMDSIRTVTIAKQEQKHGRKLTAKEMEEVDKKLKEAQEMMIAMKKGMKIGIGVEFVSDKNLVMRTKIKIDDAVLKAAGIGWMKRKAMKAALAIMPDKEKGTYHLEGNLIIVEDPKEPDTLQLSKDGQYIYGKFDKKTGFKLTRTQSGFWK